MIGKIMKNLSFKATTKYVIKKEGAQIIGGNMVMETPADLAAEFAMSESLKPMIKRPVYHFSLSLPPTEKLTDEQFAEVATQYLTGMGLDPDENQYFVARHTDTDHDHIHIVASRINLSTGAVIDDGHDYCRSQKILRDLERQFGLTVLPNSWEVGKRAESIGQLKAETKTDIVSVQKRLQIEIEAAATDHPTMPEFIERLQDKGIGVRIDFTRTGKPKGVSYVLDDVPIAGNKLGNHFSFQGLSKHLGVDYDAARDNDLVTELCSKVVKKKEIKIGIEPPEVKTEVEEEVTETESDPLEGELIEVTPPDELGDSSGLGNSIDPDPDPDIDSTTDDDPPAGAGDATTEIVPPVLVDDPPLPPDVQGLADLIDEPIGVEDTPIAPPPVDPPTPVAPTPVELTPEQQKAQDKYDQVAAKIRAEMQQVLSDEEVTKLMTVRFHRALKANQALSIDDAAALSRSPIVQKIKATEGVDAAQKRLKEITDFGFKQVKKERSRGRGKGTGR